MKKLLISGLFAFMLVFPTFSHAQTITPQQHAVVLEQIQSLMKMLLQLQEQLAELRAENKEKEREAEEEEEREERVAKKCQTILDDLQNARDAAREYKAETARLLHEAETQGGGSKSGVNAALHNIVNSRQLERFALEQKVEEKQGVWNVATECH